MIISSIITTNLVHLAILQCDFRLTWNFACLTFWLPYTSNGR